MAKIAKVGDTRIAAVGIEAWWTPNAPKEFARTVGLIRSDPDWSAPWNAIGE